MVKVWRLFRQTYIAVYNNMPRLGAIVCLFNTRYLRNEYLLSFIATLPLEE